MSVARAIMAVLMGRPSSVDEVARIHSATAAVAEEGAAGCNDGRSQTFSAAPAE